jgi:GntR family transcriptional regulator
MVVLCQEVNSSGDGSLWHDQLDDRLQTARRPAEQPAAEDSRSRHTVVTVSISRSLRVPLATQIRDQVVAAISVGDIQVGDRLPTIRELASFLGINRNTVAQAYRDLEREGYVVTRSGAGTAVIASPATDSLLRGGQLRELVREALAKAESAGFSARAFAETAYYEASSWKPSSAVSILVVDEYRGELGFLCKEISRAVPAAVEGLLLSELEQHLRDGQPSELDRFDFVVAPFYCTDHATALLEETNLPVLTVGVGPSVPTMLRIARAGEGKKVAIVCTEDSGPEQMRRALEGTAIPFARLDGYGVHDSRLHEVIGSYDLVVASEGSANEVRALVGDDRLIEFSSLLSESSLATVRGYVEHTSRKKTADKAQA